MTIEFGRKLATETRNTWIESFATNFVVYNTWPWHRSLSSATRLTLATCSTRLTLSWGCILPQGHATGQGRISRQPGGAGIVTYLRYRAGLAAASGRSQRVELWASVCPRRSLVKSLTFESKMPFNGLATPSEGRHAVENGGVLPRSDGDENWACGVTELSPLHKHNILLLHFKTAYTCWRGALLVKLHSGDLCCYLRLPAFAVVRVRDHYILKDFFLFFWIQYLLSEMYVCQYSGTFAHGFGPNKSFVMLISLCLLNPHCPTS